MINTLILGIFPFKLNAKGIARLTSQQKWVNQKDYIMVWVEFDPTVSGVGFQKFKNEGLD